MLLLGGGFVYGFAHIVAVKNGVNRIKAADWRLH